MIRSKSVETLGTSPPSSAVSRSERYAGEEGRGGGGGGGRGGGGKGERGRRRARPVRAVARPRVLLIICNCISQSSIDSNEFSVDGLGLGLFEHF